MASRAGAALTATDIEFALASPDDWSEIWPIFREVVGAGDTYAFPADIDSEDAFDVWMKDGEDLEATFVARIDGLIVATAYLKPNHPGSGDHVANAGWMVSPSQQGRGVGRRFAEHVITEARKRGYHAMQFNAVVATNTGAIELWKSLGFETVGTVPDAFRHPTEGLVPIHIMYRRL